VAVAELDGATNGLLEVVGRFTLSGADEPKETVAP